MKPLNWVELTRQQIKARHGFGWSIQGIEKQNKVITKIVYRFSNGQRSTVITDIEWNTNNSKKILTDIFNINYLFLIHIRDSKSRS